MFYHEEGDPRSSLARDVCQNEIISGQDWGYIQKELQSVGERAFDFDPTDYRVLLTGLPKSVYTGVYGRSANDMMRILLRLERRMEALWQERSMRGEIVLHLYGQKQLFLLFTAGGADEREAALAEETARTACEFLQEIYEKGFLTDGRYANAAFLSPRLHRRNGIGQAADALLAAWQARFFDPACRVWLPGDWNSRAREGDRAAMQEAQYQLRMAVLRGDPEAADIHISSLFALLRRAQDAYLLSAALEALKREAAGFSDSLGSGPAGEALDHTFDRASYAHIGGMEAAASALFAGMARRVLGMGNTHGLLADRAMRLIAEHLTEENLGLPFVADRLGITPAYLSSLFKRETGQGFAQYVAAQRMDRAARALRETSLPITAIAAQCGFADAKYFSTRFRRAMSCSPQQYRERKKEAKG